MNRLAAASIALALAATFASPVAAARLPADHAVLIVDCTSGARPSMRAVADFLGVENSQQVYSAREKIMTQARSECRRANAAQVAIVGRKLESNALLATRDK